MLAMARILRTGAKLLLLDEISEGLAPVIVQALAERDPHAARSGFTIVLVEQNFRFAAPLADRFYVIEHGRIVETFAATELAARWTCCTSARRVSPDRPFRAGPPWKPMKGLT
jgi:branched-chain amino acid transport system ATP-binding protein